MCIQFLHPHSIISFNFSTETPDRSNKQPQRWFMRIYQVFTDSEKRFSQLILIMSFTWSLSWQRIYKYSVELESMCTRAPSCRELDWKTIIGVFENAIVLKIRTLFLLIAWVKFSRNCKMDGWMDGWVYWSELMDTLNLPCNGRCAVILFKLVLFIETWNRVLSCIWIKWVCCRLIASSLWKWL